MAYKITVNGKVVETLNSTKLPGAVLRDYVLNSKAVKAALGGPLTVKCDVKITADSVDITGDAVGVVDSKPAVPKLGDVKVPQAGGVDKGSADRK